MDDVRNDRTLAFWCILDNFLWRLFLQQGLWWREIALHLIPPQPVDHSFQISPNSPSSSSAVLTFYTAAARPLNHPTWTKLGIRKKTPPGDITIGPNCRFSSFWGSKFWTMLLAPWWWQKCSDLCRRCELWVLGRHSPTHPKTCHPSHRTSDSLSLELSDALSCDRHNSRVDVTGLGAQPGWICLCSWKKHSWHIRAH